MGKPLLLIFDLDGTLMDTSQGIFNTALAVMEALHLPHDVTPLQMKKFVGPPLDECFRVVFHLDESYMNQATSLYHERYVAKGQYEAVVYEGMEETLKTLTERGYILAVGTSKTETTAQNMLAHMGVAKYFKTIRGDLLSLGRSKADVINLVLQELDVAREQAILIGDTLHDLRGATQSHVGFVAVTYGFGFTKDQEKLKEMKAIVSTPLELLTLFP
ncbi:MAG: HAD hydrolase-like protein [Sphaerochaetaceae bacterium]